MEVIALELFIDAFLSTVDTENLDDDQLKLYQNVTNASDPVRIGRTMIRKSLLNDGSLTLSGKGESISISAMAKMAKM